MAQRNYLKVTNNKINKNRNRVNKWAFQLRCFDAVFSEKSYDKIAPVLFPNIGFASPSEMKREINDHYKPAKKLVDGDYKYIFFAKK